MSNASRFVRASKFRHVFAETSKPEGCYSTLDLSPVTGDHNYVRASGKFFSVAVRGGGGPVLVLPFSATGRLPMGYPLINGHSAAVYDTAWNPFNDNMLATGSDDTTVKVWSIPDGGLTESLKDPLVTLSGHGKPVTLLSWHPTAENVLASVGKDPCVKIWDVTSGANKLTLDGFGGLVQVGAGEEGIACVRGPLRCGASRVDSVRDLFLASVSPPCEVCCMVHPYIHKLTFALCAPAVQDFAWNATGSLLATSDKAKVRMRVCF